MLREGKEPPEAICKNSLDDQGHMLHFLWCYQDLETCRSMGLGPAKIPWTAIHQYGKEFLGLENDSLGIFIYAIQKLDQTWFEWASEQKSK